MNNRILPILSCICMQYKGEIAIVVIRQHESLPPLYEHFSLNGTELEEHVYMVHA